MPSVNDSILVGLSKSRKALDELGPKISKNVVRRAVYSGAIVIRDAARQKVAVDTGALRSAIVVKPNARKPGEISAGVGVQKKEFLKGKRAGKNPRRYAHLVEFGSVKMRAEPFMRPAIDANTDKTIEVTVQSIAKGIDDEVRKIGGRR